MPNKLLKPSLPTRAEISSFRFSSVCSSGGISIGRPDGSVIYPSPEYGKVLFPENLTCDSLVAGRNDSRVFYHKNHRALRSPGAVHDTFGNDEALPWVESYQPIFEIDQELALDYVKKLVVLVVFVPMVFTTKNSQPHD